MDDYKGKLSFGVAIGGGIVGIPVRTYISPKFALEIGAFYRPAIVLTAGSSDALRSV